MRSTTIHNQVYEKYDWAELGNDIFALAEKIIKQGNKYDRIIALAKGGYALSKSLNDLLQVRDLSSIQVEFYTGINQHNKTPVITQSLPVSIRDERVLVFDDLVDSGITLELAVKYLMHHGAQSLDTATLITKPWSKFMPDFSVRSSEAWVIFPNETCETITTLQKLWAKAGDSDAEINLQLAEIGYTEAEVALCSVSE